VRDSQGQVQDVCREIAATAKAKMRTLVTTLTKRQAEDLAEHLAKSGIKARYLHSEIDTLERTDLIRRLRLGEFDCLVGVNLLREGLDIPEVGLVAVLDADKEGFLRNETSLIQTSGRAARNADGRVVMYAQQRTASIDNAVAEMQRRRAYQQAYNLKRGIIPSTIVKKVDAQEGEDEGDATGKSGGKVAKIGSVSRRKLIELELDMRRASESLDFEKAIEIRETLRKLGRL